MRIFTNGRGCPPPVDADCIHCWVFDKSSGTATVQDLKANSYDLSTTGGTPTTTTDSDIGKYARVHAGGSTQYTTGAANGVDSGLTSRTIVGSFKLVSGSTGSAPLVCYEGAGSPSTCFAIYYIAATRKLRIRWQDSGGGTVDTDSVVALPYGKWIHFAVTLSVSGTTDVRLFLGGAKSDSATGKANPRTTSASQRWVFGAGGGLGTGESVNWSCCAVYNVAKSDAWVEDTLRSMLLWDKDTYTPVKVEVCNNAGTFVDVSTAFPVDFLNSASVKDDVDQNVVSATIQLWREQQGYSLAKYHDNPLNRTPLPSASAIGPGSQTYTAPGGGTSSEALALDRAVRIHTCRMPLGVSPTAADWQLYFDGYIDSIDWGGDGDNITVECRDLGARIQDAHIMTDEVYGSTGGTAVETVSQSILNDAASAAKAPRRWGLQTGWPRTATAPTLVTGWDGKVCMPAASPSWNLREWAQSRMPVLEALNVLWEQIGFKCRYMWVPADGAFKLVAYEPTRLRFDRCWVLTQDDVMQLSQFKVDKASIRTTCLVTYASRETSAPAVPSIATGTTTQAVGSAFWEAPSSENQSGGAQAADGWGRAGIIVKADDLHSTEPASGAIAEYGYIPCEIAEPAGGNIDTIAEAQRIAVAVVRDLAFPKADIGAELRSFPELNVYDYGILRANDKWSTSDFSLAATSLEQRWSSDGDSTVVALRGTPAGGHQRHLEKEARPGVASPPSTTAANADRDIPPRLKKGILRTLQKNTGFWRESTKVAIRNGDFSHRNFGSNPPDCWRMNAGTWGTDIDVDTSTVDLGVHSLKIMNNTGKLETDDYIPINSASNLQVEARVRTSAASINAKVEVEWFDGSKASLGSTAVFDWTPPSSGTWFTHRGIVQADASARYYRVRVSRTGGGAGNCFFNRVQSIPLKPAFEGSKTAAQGPIGAKTLTKVTWDSEPSDWGNNFDLGNERFVCPEDGYYEFGSFVHVYSDNTAQWIGLHVMLRKNGGDWMAQDTAAPTSNAHAPASQGTHHANCTIKTGPMWLARGDYIEVFAAGATSGGADWWIADDCVFSGRGLSVE